MPATFMGLSQSLTQPNMLLAAIRDDRPDQNKRIHFIPTLFGGPNLKWIRSKSHKWLSLAEIDRHNTFITYISRHPGVEEALTRDIGAAIEQSTQPKNMDIAAGEPTLESLLRRAPTAAAVP